MKMTIENIIETVKVNTECLMGNTTYKVIDVQPYSKECSTPSYKLKVIDQETIEELKIEIDTFNKNNPYHKISLSDALIMDRIEPMWFIARKAKILN
jgi:hypothetical protein